MAAPGISSRDLGSRFPQLRVIGDFCLDLLSVLDDHAVRLWSGDDLVDRARIEHDEARRYAKRQLTMACEPTNPRGCRPDQRRRAAKRMI